MHTAIVLLSHLPPSTLASSYLAAPAEVVRPAIGEPPRSWASHTLPRSLGQHLLPAGLASGVHPLLRSPRTATPVTSSPTPHQSPLRLLAQYVAGAELDGEWDADDPWPWFALAHVHWPWLLLRSLRHDRGWSRLNVRHFCLPMQLMGRCPRRGSSRSKRRFAPLSDRMKIDAFARSRPPVRALPSERCYCRRQHADRANDGRRSRARHT